MSSAVALILAGGAAAWLTPMPVTGLTWSGLARGYDLPDVAVSKDDGVSVVYVGSLVTYTITVENVGTAAAAHVSIDDPVPDGLVVCEWACDVKTPCSPTSGVDDVVTTIPTLEPGVVGTIVFVCEVGAGVGNSVTNTVFAITSVDADSTNNTFEDVNIVGIFADGFESGDVSAWSSASRPHAD